MTAQRGAGLASHPASHILEPGILGTEDCGMTVDAQNFKQAMRVTDPEWFFWKAKKIWPVTLAAKI